MTVCTVFYVLTNIAFYAGVTVDELLGNMPKMMRIADAMHDMVG